MRDNRLTVQFAGAHEFVTRSAATHAILPAVNDSAVRIMARISIGHGIAIDEAELSESFVRGSGPGGQNVNKVATAVQLRFDAARSRAMPADVLGRLLKLAGRRATKEGEIVIVANRFRTQERNREDARERLFALIGAAAEPPPPPRRKTRPTRASKERRLTDKKRRAEIKRGRGAKEN